MIPSPVLVLGFINFIRENPGFTAWLISGLLISITGLVGVYYHLIYDRLGALEKVDAALTMRVTEVEMQLERYEEHIGAGDRALGSLTEKIEKHMEQEEAQVWRVVREVNEKLSQIQVENAEAHAEIVTSHGQRLATIEAQLSAVKRGLPNGDIQEILLLLKKLMPA